MAAGAKRKTTMAKLNREAAVRERRLRKQARKDARKAEAASVKAEAGKPEVGADAEADAPEDQGL
jgi:hypothetical protein